MAFYESHSATLIPILLKVVKKLISYSHHYICHNLLDPEQSLAEDMADVINKILSISGTKLLQGKAHSKPLFVTHIPNAMSERLKDWNSIFVLEKSQLNKISSFSTDKVNVVDEFFAFLDSSFKSFTGVVTFTPSRLLKTSLLLTTTLVASVLGLKPDLSREKFLKEVVPLATDLVLEFAAEDMGNECVMEAPLKEIAHMFNAESFSQECVGHKVRK